MTLSPRHLLLAALLHLALFILLFTGVQCSKKIETPPVVQGVLINPSQIPHPQPPEPQAPPQPKPQEDQGPQPKVDADVMAEQAKQEQKKQEEQEQQRKQAEAAEAEKQKEVAEQKQKEEDAIALKKQQEEEAQKKKQEEEAEAAKAAEDLKKQAAQEEQERQAAALAEKVKEEAAKRQAEQRKQAIADLQQQLGVESGALTQQLQSEWALQLIAAIRAKFHPPPGTDPNLKAILQISLSNRGQVLSARITAGSGVPIFDASVTGAAYQASPLPLPRDMSAFQNTINVCFSQNPSACQ